VSTYLKRDTRASNRAIDDFQSNMAGISGIFEF
jgi:hypothetical protein